MGDVVAESAACVSAGRVGFVDFGGDEAVMVELPTDLFEIADEFLAAGVNEEAALGEVIEEAGVYAIDAVADERIGVDGVERGAIEVFPGVEEIADDLPVGSGTGGAAMAAAGIAVNFYGEGALEAGELPIERLGTFVEELAGGLSRGFGLDDQLIKNVDVFANALQEEHAHGIDVEIERPDEGIGRSELDGLHVAGRIKGMIDAMGARHGELAFELTLENFRIEIARGVGEFFLIHQATLRGGELKDLPSGLGFGLLDEVVEMIAAQWSADEEDTAFAVGQSGAENVGPDAGFERGELVEDEEIYADAAEVVRFEGAVEADDGAVNEVDAGGFFDWGFGPEVAGHGF